jgi:uncharacterized BrkB/YihY/UPF0761 family membrane protein
VDAFGESPAGASAREEAERRTRALAERAARSPLGRHAPRLSKVWHTAGADLLAGSLRFASIFALVSALLLTTGLISLVVADEAQRARGVGILAILMWQWVSFNAIVLGASWVRLRTKDAAVAEGTG